MKTFLVFLFISIAITSCGDVTQAPPKLRIAVASNFQIPMSALIKAYNKQNPRADIAVSSASSGVLLAQVKRGAPFELFFSADSQRPLELAKELNLQQNVFTYAIGRLVLWAPNMDSVNLESLSQLDTRIAIAKPDLAPYGLATKQLLQKKGVWDGFESKIIYGNNVTQVEHFIKTGAVEAGFLSLAQVIHSNADMKQVWEIPEKNYDAIEQKVILLNKESDSKLAKHFLNFVLSDSGQDIINQLGYGVLPVDGVLR